MRLGIYIMVDPEDVASGLSGNTLLIMSAIRTIINYHIENEVVITLGMLCSMLNLKSKTIKRLICSLAMTGHVEILNPEAKWDDRVYKIPERNE